MITREILEETARKKRLFNKEYIEKDYFQDLLLFNIYKQTNLLIFKGGTALSKLYGLQRFSEDLDFTLMGDTNIEETIRKALLNINNSDIKEIKRLKNSISIKIAFKGIITKYNTVRIDINLKNIILEKFNVKNYVSSYPDINPFNLRVLSLKEIVAEKIHSLLNRESARDLYDLFFLLKFVDIDKQLITKKLEIFDMKINHSTLKKRVNNLKGLWEKELSSFVLYELPKFNEVSKFVLKKLSELK